MAESMILNMLKTPQQVREEQLAKLRERSTAQAKLLAAPVSATTGIPGMLRSFAAGEMLAQGEDLNKAARRATGAAGGLLSAFGRPEAGRAVAESMISPEERQAQASQEIMKQTNMGDMASLKAAAQKFRQAGNLKGALALEQRVADLASSQAEIAIKQREAEVKEQKNQIEKDKSYAAITLKVGDEVIKNSDPTSVAEALAMVAQNPNNLNDARKLLKAKPGAKTEITIDQKGESEFAKTLGKEQAKAYVTSTDNIKANAASVRTLNEMESLLNEGEIYTGSGAPVFLQAAKALEMVTGLADEEKIVRTETFMKTAAQEVLNIMGSGKLGAGTGLSDGDRKFAEQVVAGDISLDAKTIRRLIDTNRRANVYAIKQHNEKVDRLNKRYTNANLQREFYIGQEAVVDNVTYTYDGEGWVVQ